MMHQETDEQKRKKILDFMRAHHLGVLATVNQKGMPEAAVVGFAENENFEIFFGTFTGSRKYRNLARNAHVAMVIGWEQGKTVQLEGLAQEITDKGEIDKVTKIQLAKIPSAAKYVKESKEAFFKIRPSWIRYSDLSVDPWHICEINFLS